MTIPVPFVWVPSLGLIMRRVAGNRAVAKTATSKR